MKNQDDNFENYSSGDAVLPYQPQVIGIAADNHTDKTAQERTEGTPSSKFSSTSTNFFKSLQWSADGTTILTSSATNTFSSYILPPTLLNPPHPHALTSYTTHKLPEPAYAATFYPSYSLTDPSTCLFLTSPRNLPLRLHSTLGGGILGSYPLISPTTEVYIAPHSLIFASIYPNQILAGSDGMIAIFDITRPGEEPVTVMRTHQKRRARTGALCTASEAGGGLRGIVSAMDMSRDGVLAAGTFGRNIGLYENHGYGETNAIFSVADENDRQTDGNGITQVIWDDSGRYLCVVERGSDGVGVWDVRGTGKRLAWLSGRRAQTSQRMSVAVVTGEVWAGGTDGIVRVWHGLGMREGTVEKDWEFGAHGDVVSGIGLHPTGGILATCSGQRHYCMTDQWEIDEDEGSNSDSPMFENSLKVWAL